MRRLLGLRHQVHDIIDELTSLVEEKHELGAQQWVDRLSRVEPVGRVARQVDEVRRRLARALFDGIRGTNRRVQGICDGGIELVKRALEGSLGRSSRPPADEP